MPDSKTEPMTVDEDCEWGSSDGAVSKVVLTNGVWDGSPREGGVCRVKFEEVCGDGSPSDYLREGRNEVVIGEADTELDRLIDRALRRMWTGEKSRVNLLDRVVFVVTLERFTNPPTPFYALDAASKAKLAEVHKEKGSQLFKQGRIGDAFFRFQKAARCVIFADVEQNVDLYCKICNNLALCRLRMDQPEEAIKFCHKVLTRRENNVKGLVRRAEALLLTHEPESAKDDLNKALELDPVNSAAKRLLALAQKDILQERANSTAMAKKMLSL